MLLQSHKRKDHEIRILKRESYEFSKISYR
jgi:hypothetical protein